ncbi:sugar-transfer associated ATP-grasp domain-containing protein [Microvirga arsenatis]|uniref:acylphosphatase n=1 Tax=Microvirga arsenatis TaxID=2692265 RepID=A0ABW9YSP4_9HYPH|nr:sugar-transfer associated ATP-grasp domain-containing protein [Microvirga arsenatis]NBJ10061.1 transposase [Microvirga arsenatis]NBJ23129.1 transposase [Microvirga arsenatis]
MKRPDNPLNEETGAESFVRAWFPSCEQTGRKKGSLLLTFLREHNKFYNIGPRSRRRILQDKFLLSAFLAGIGISAPVTRWIVVKNIAFSPQGQRIPTRDLVPLLSTGRWFVKARSGRGGKGAFLLDNGIIRKADGSTGAIGETNLLKLLKSHKSILVQDVVLQSEDYSVFSPSSLNTIRCLTYLTRSGEVQIVAATLRMGTGSSVVDNVSLGGIYCGIDLDSHRLIHAGLIDEGKNLGSKSFEKHPTSNVVLPGYKLNRLDDVFAICKSAHEALGGPMTVGWDVAMTDSGPCIIEGNASWTTTLHSLTDRSVKQRVSKLLLRDYKFLKPGYRAGQSHIKRKSLATVVFRVKGRVQGVGYRRWASRLAREKGLRGQAFNLDNGDVEVMLTGPLWLIEFAVFACMSGPRKAKVTGVEILSLLPLTQADEGRQAPARIVKPTRSAPSLPAKTSSLQTDDREIAAYIHDIRYEDIPAEVTERAKVLLLDSLGMIVLGSSYPVAVPITNIARETAGGQEAAIFRTDLRRSSQIAAFANAAYMQIQDLIDEDGIAIAAGASAHPGRIVIPTALAECERRKATGKDLLTALVIGYDVAGKIRGQSVGTKSSYCAAAAIAARLRGQSMAQISTAMRLAGYASQSQVGSRVPAHIAPYSRGLCARIGIEAAIAAGAGQEGPTLRYDPAVSSGLTERGLGTRFEVMSVYLKGDSTNLLTPEEVTLKFRSNGSPVLGQATAERIVQIVQKIEAAESLQELVDCLCMNPDNPTDLLKGDREASLSTRREALSTRAIKDTRLSFQRRYSKDFQDEAVRLALTSGRKYHEIAADLGVGRSTLRHWVSRRRAGEIEHPPAGRQDNIVAEQNLMR